MTTTARTTSTSSFRFTLNRWIVGWNTRSNYNACVPATTRFVFRACGLESNSISPPLIGGRGAYYYSTNSASNMRSSAMNMMMVHNNIEQNRNYSTTRTKSLSSSSSSSSGTSTGNPLSPMYWARKAGGAIQTTISNRNEKQQNKQYMDRIDKICNLEKYTVNDMYIELDEAVKKSSSFTSWLTQNTNDIQTAKRTHLIMDCISAVIGRDATSDTLEKMSSTDKLRITALAIDIDNQKDNKISGGKDGKAISTEEVNNVIRQFHAMDLLHRTLRQHKLDGKQLPTKPQEIEELVKREAGQYMSKSQKRQMRDKLMKHAKRGRR